MQFIISCKIALKYLRRKITSLEDILILAKHIFSYIGANFEIYFFYGFLSFLNCMMDKMKLYKFFRNYAS